jgi:hypothetical protein
MSGLILVPERAHERELSRKRYAISPRVREKRKQSSNRFTETIPGRSKALFRAAKTRANRLGCMFSIDAPWIETRLAAGHCEVTGIPFDLKRGFNCGHRPWSPSLDRKNPGDGYTKENTQLVVFAYNAAKGGWTHEEVLKLSNALVTNKA